MTFEHESTLARGVRLRRGGTDDLSLLLAIRAGLPMPSSTTATQSGGFLLGSDPSTYQRLLEVGLVWILELDGEAAGFTLCLADPVLRASPLWARRHEAQWSPALPMEALLSRRIAYFDQLAVLPGLRSRLWGAALALRALDELFDPQAPAGEHDLVLTTTVIEPIVNAAALPYLARVGAQRIGTLDERYPAVGRVVSALHLIDAGAYRQHIGALARRPGPATRRVLAGARSLPELGRLLGSPKPAAPVQPETA